MKISKIQHTTVTIPLNTTFRTALRTVTTMENVLVTIETDEGVIGYGSGAPTTVITGETIGSIRAAIDHIAEHLTGMELDSYENLFRKLNSCIIGNMSAKAAVDIALHDLIARKFNVPLATFLGGPVREVITDITISLDNPEKMAAKTIERIGEGYRILKIKVGGNPVEDIARLKAVRDAAGPDIAIRIDANQAWNPKQAIEVARLLEQNRLDIELMEQPVPARDFKSFKFVRDHVTLPVYADESVFSARDALDLIAMEAVDGINIKLMKCGGIYNACKIAAIADGAGIPCMIGSMMECSISVGAAAHLAASRQNITSFDLDAPLFCSVNPAEGGINYERGKIHLSEKPGLGITAIIS